MSARVFDHVSVSFLRALFFVNGSKVPGIGALAVPFDPGPSAIR
jgi:hypothetical protein